MLYLLHFQFVSSLRLLNPLPLLMLDAYSLQVVWLAHPLSYPLLDNTSNISLSFLEVMLYIDMFVARMVCNIICKCYASLIVTHDRYQAFLHVSHICQNLPKPNCFLRAMASGHVLRLHRRQCNDWLFLHFHEITPLPITNMYPVVDRQSFASPV